MAKTKNSLLPLILIATACGLAAGVAAELVTRIYFIKDISSPYLSSEINLSSLNNNRSNLIIQDAKKVVVNQDVKVEETISSIRPTLVGIFKEQASSEKSVASEPASYYKLDDPILVGLTVTADGWIAVSAPDDLRKNLGAKGYVAITSDRKVYKVDQISSLGSLPGELVFLHLANATNLPVKKIVPRSEISLGQSLLTVNNFSNVLLTSLSSFKKTPPVLSSDSLNARLTLAGNPEKLLSNSFVFNLAGDLVAVIGGNQEIVPAFSYNTYWRSLLKNGSAAQPFLGVNYLDLSSTKPADITLEKGAWLHRSDDSPAVIKGSPAESAGLAEGDVITWVNNQELDAANDLADIISTFKPGDSLTLTYVRAGAEKEATIKLGTKK